MKNGMIHKFNHERFGEIRTIMRDGEPWFVGNDVCSKLGYGNPRDAMNRHVGKTDTVNYGIVGEDNRTREATLINESGLYSLIMRSKKPDAQKFQRWVTSEVLPSIRKTGTYSTSQAPVDLSSLMQMTQQNANLLNTTVSVINQELVKVNSTLEHVSDKISAWEDKTDNERSNRRISYAQTTVDFPAKVKQMVYMASGAEVGGKTKIYLSAKKYLLNELLDVNRTNDITLGQWAHIDELIADNRDTWYAGYLKRLEDERLKQSKAKKSGH